MDEQLENIYLNINLYGGNEPYFNTANYDTTRITPILAEPENYLLGIEQASVSLLDVPIFLWKDNKFKIIMEYDGTVVEKFLQFIPNETVTNPYGNSIWSYNEFVKIINVALKDGFDDLKAIHPTAPPTESPFVLYDSSTELYSFYAQKLYDTNTNTIKVSFNYELFYYFGGFPSFVNELAPQIYYAQILVYNQYFNSVKSDTYYKMVSSFNTNYRWYDLQRIEIHSNSIPIYPDIEGDTQTNRTIQKLLDLEVKDFELNPSQIIQYTSSDEKIWKSIKDSMNLQRINLKFVWIDKDNNIYPLFLDKDEPTTVKIRFKSRYAEQLEEENNLSL